MGEGLWDREAAIEGRVTADKRGKGGKMYISTEAKMFVSWPFCSATNPGRNRSIKVHDEESIDYTPAATLLTSIQALIS